MDPSRLAIPVAGEQHTTHIAYLQRLNGWAYLRDLLLSQGAQMQQ